MKIIKYFLFVTVFAVTTARAQVVAVDLRDNARLQWAGAAVKQRGIVSMFSVSRDGEFTVGVTISLYVNNGGAYGAKITDVITADVDLTQDEKNRLLKDYGDRYFEHSTAGQFANPANGELVASNFPGAVTELAYWQSFRLNQVAGVGTVANTNAMQAMYLTITAIVNRMNVRKNW